MLDFEGTPYAACDLLLLSGVFLLLYLIPARFPSVASTGKVVAHPDMSGVLHRRREPSMGIFVHRSAALWWQRGVTPGQKLSLPYRKDEYDSCAMSSVNPVRKCSRSVHSEVCVDGRSSLLMHPRMKTAHGACVPA